jgi:hypothetical protein
MAALHGPSSKTGPDMGQPVPASSAQDQDGRNQTLKSIRPERGHARFLPFCGLGTVLQDPARRANSIWTQSGSRDSVTGSTFRIRCSRIRIRRSYAPTTSSNERPGRARLPTAFHIPASMSSMRREESCPSTLKTSTRTVSLRLTFWPGSSGRAISGSRRSSNTRRTSLVLSICRQCTVTWNLPERANRFRHGTASVIRLRAIWGDSEFFQSLSTRPYDGSSALLTRLWRDQRRRALRARAT